ncbi:hypothetical protein VV02_24345 [Luteipulveratus mongoliensis]|uniref:Uncharacterized protein n=1 Tax=Luteipulveratus mongoliensis TaxID=571913 RepID=A0A0K1JNT8_9MICO|nr:hypothetical protein VV02_24345 [Luteipulveratus mongoliensis]
MAQRRGELSGARTTGGAGPRSGQRQDVADDHIDSGRLLLSGAMDPAAPSGNAVDRHLYDVAVGEQFLQRAFGLVGATSLEGSVPESAGSLHEVIAAPTRTSPPSPRTERRDRSC